MVPHTPPSSLEVEDLGRLGYAPAYDIQAARVAAVLEAREAGSPRAGFLLLVEHDPVVTVSRRPGAAAHLLATPELLAARGVDVQTTDRGGDITYHGPGQLVAYPILDLSLLSLGLHDYMRLLEDAVMDVCGRFGVATAREAGATGVWVPQPAPPFTAPAKIAAMGVRLRRWVSMHGLALNVTTDLSHFGLIVPCGLVGRPVTSLERELGRACPGMDEVRGALVDALGARVDAALASAVTRRGGGE